MGGTFVALIDGSLISFLSCPPSTRRITQASPSDGVLQIEHAHNRNNSFLRSLKPKPEDRI